MGSTPSLTTRVGWDTQIQTTLAVLRWNCRDRVGTSTSWPLQDLSVPGRHALDVASVVYSLMGSDEWWLQATTAFQLQYPTVEPLILYAPAGMLPPEIVYQTVGPRMLRPMPSPSLLEVLPKGQKDWLHTSTTAHRASLALSNLYHLRCKELLPVAGTPTGTPAAF